MTRYRNAHKKKRFLQVFNAQKHLFLLSAIPLVWILVFAILPLAGIIIAFKNFNFVDGIFGSPWAGLKYFRNLLTDFHFPKIIRNTVSISLLKIIIGFPFPIIFALLINELPFKRLKKTTQTISYLPYFISWVVIIGILKLMLASDGGLLNNLLISLKLIDRPINFLITEKYIWPIAVISDIWKFMGWNSIIFLAGISAVDPGLYEAITVDGGGRFRRMWHVTLPGIRHLIVISLILSVGSIFSVSFDQMWLLNTGPVGDVAEVLDTYIYRVGLKGMQYGLGMSAQILRCTVVFVLVSIANKLANKYGDGGLW